VTQQSKPMSERTIGNVSPSLLTHTKSLIFQAINEPRVALTVQQILDRHTFLAPPAFLCAAAFMEAYVNERYLSQFARFTYPNSEAWKLSEQEFARIDWMKFKHKIRKLPKLLANKIVDAQAPAVRDARVLYEVRNAITHYRFIFGSDGEKLADGLEKRGLGRPRLPGNLTWVQRISTVRVMQWAYNTTIGLLQLLIDGENDYDAVVMRAYTPLTDDVIVKAVEAKSFKPEE
jgi:hypothetical protein